MNWHSDIISNAYGLNQKSNGSTIRLFHIFQYLTAN